MLADNVLALIASCAIKKGYNNQSITWNGNGYSITTIEQSGHHIIVEIVKNGNKTYMFCIYVYLCKYMYMFNKINAFIKTGFISNNTYYYNIYICSFRYANLDDRFYNIKLILYNINNNNKYNI